MRNHKNILNEGMYIYIYIYIYIYNRKVSGIKITHEIKMLPKVKEQVTDITI